MSIESHKKMLSRVHVARLAQSVEHETLNLRVVGSSPTLGEHVFYLFLSCAVTFMICFDMINMPETLFKRELKQLAFLYLINLVLSQFSLEF